MPFRRPKPGLLALAVIAVMVIGVYWKLTLVRQYTFIEAPDIGHQVLPWLQVQAAAVHQGVVALWDPYIFGGQPLLGQVQPAVASPVAWLLMATPLKDGHLRLGAVHWWFVLIHCLAGWFAYALFRDLGRSRAAAVFAATLFGAGGFIGNTAWPQIVVSAIWAPLIFLFLLRSLAGRRPAASAALAGLFLGLALLSGHHAVPVFLALAVAGAAIAAVIRHPVCWRPVLARVAVLAVCAALAGALQVLPAYEYGQHAVRWVTSANPVDWKTPVPYFVHGNLGLKPLDLLFLCVPGGGSGMIDPIVGVVGLMFAALAIVLSPARAAVRFFTALAVAALLFSLARFDFAHGVLYSIIPGLEKARAPIMALSVAHFAIAVLAAFGLDAFLSASSAPALRRAWIVAAAASPVFFALALFPPSLLQTAPHGPDRTAMVAVICLLLAWLLYAWSAGRLTRAGAAASAFGLLLLELGLSTGFNYVHVEDKASLARPRLYGGTSDLAAFLKRQPGPFRVSYNYDDLVFNFSDWYGVESMAGFVPSAPAAVYELGWWGPRVRNLYGVRYWIGRQPDAQFPHEVFHSEGGWNIYENPDAFPRAWAVHDLVRAAGLRHAARLVRDSGVDLRTQAVVEVPPPHVERCAAPDRVAISYRNLQSLAIDAEMACAGVVVLADNAFPGWRATVDGAPAEIVTVDVALRGVALPAGKHRIEMEYRPASALWGLILTLAGLALAGALALRRESDGASCFNPAACGNGARSA
jgi:hypothetical protein